MLGLTLDILRGSGFGASGGGSGPSSGYTPPLDSVTAAVAYSVRKLNSTYTGNCMLVRRVSDGATQDIGFDSDGLIDVAALTAFSGGVELTVKVWYDQAGGGYDLEQPNDAYLPTIYDGTAVTTSTSGKPCVRIVRVANSGPGEWLQTDPVSLSTAGDMDVFLVMHGPLATSGDRYFWNGQAGPTTSGARWGIAYNTNSYVQQPGPSTSIQITSTPIPDNLQFILNAQFNPSGNINTLEGNGFEFGTYTSSTTYRTDPYNVTLSARTGGTEGYNSFDISEIIHLPTYNASENASLGSNINSYYEFTNWTPTSGFLADYPDAAAAYSVRKLSNNAIKCMRVRRAVAPFDEKDIGFTPGGDLDEAAIVAFGGSDELLVSAWYDQSGQSNHATQITPSAQPQIYDGTAVITENGKPGVEFTTFDNLTFTSTDIYSFFIVSRPTSINTGSANFAVGLTTSLKGIAVAGDSGSRQARAYSNTGTLNMTGIGVSNNQSLVDYVTTGTNGKLRYNGANELVGSATEITVDQLGSCQSLNYRVLNGPLQEIVMYASDQDSNRTGIETNIMTYFSIP